MKAGWIAPQLATLKKEIFSEINWIFEEKFDGIRCIAIKSKGKVSLYSRNHKSLNLDFPEIVAQMESEPSRDYVVDGEIVAFEGKVTSFSKLQRRGHEKTKVYFYIFDLLFWDRAKTTSLPLLERKKLLKTHFPFGGLIRYTPHVSTKGEAFFKKGKEKGWEGVIGKRGDSLYLSKRTNNWLKFKYTPVQEFVIGGYTEPQRSRIGFGALLIGYYEKGKLLYAGKVGTGYDTALLTSLSRKLSSLKRAHSPFATQLKEKTAHFVHPSLVCEVGFTEWTKEGKLRHPRFLGLRKDKPAKNVLRERSK